MNPDYLWLTGAVQLLTFFLVAPVLAIAIAYTAWLQKPKNLNSGRYGTWCVVSGVIAFLMLVFAKWLNADVRTPQYFLQLGAILLSSLLFGVFMGCGFSAPLACVAVAQGHTIRRRLHCAIVGVTLAFTHSGKIARGESWRIEAVI